MNSGNQADTLPPENTGSIPTLSGRVSWEVHLRRTTHGRSIEAVAEYTGTAEALVLVGCATAEMIAPGKKGTPRRDEQGHHFRRWPRGRQFTVRRHKPIEAATQLPRVTTILLERLVSELRREEEQVTQATTAAAEVLSPDAWKQKMVGMLDFYAGFVARLSDTESVLFGELDSDFDVLEADAALFRERAHSTFKELHELLAAVRIRRSAAPQLRLVVDNGATATRT